jgi:hypothetical protein
MTYSERPRTINSKGEIVPKPYGPSRWASPRIRPCVHSSDGIPCENPAAITARTGAHAIDETGKDTAHNCCGTH